jgi:alpha-galactosidase
MGDVLSYPVLSDSTISLTDVDADRPDRTRRVAERVVEHNDSDATVEATTDRREALDGADSVLNTIHVGGLDPFENEIRIPEEYGVGQAVGDTLGPGGVFRAARTVPATVDDLLEAGADYLPGELLAG